MWPALVGRVGRSSSYDANDLCGGPPAVTTTICADDVFTFAQGALGIKYTLLAPVSEIEVSECGRGEKGVVGLHLGNCNNE